jgi:hypothetical protein
VGWDYFEELRYDRADIATTLLQFAQARYLEGRTVPPDVPCRFFFGRNDELLALDTEPGRQAYRDHVVSLIPHAELCGLQLDHFGRGPDHDPVIQRLGDFFEESEAQAVSPVPTGKFGTPQDADR